MFKVFILNQFIVAYNWLKHFYDLSEDEITTIENLIKTLQK